MCESSVFRQALDLIELMERLIAMGEGSMARKARICALIDDILGV